MKDALFYSAIALGVLFTLAQFATHVPDRYYRDDVTRPYTFRDRFAEACESRWIPVFMCTSLYAVAVPFVYFYGIWKGKPDGFVLRTYISHWGLLALFAVICIIQQIGKGLDSAAQDSESFKEHTNRRLTAIERRLWSGYHPEDKTQ